VTVFTAKYPNAQAYTRQVRTTGNVVAPCTVEAEYCYILKQFTTVINRNQFP